MYNYRKLGYCANPDSTTKGLVFSNTYQHLRNLSELAGEVIHPNHEEFIANAYEKSTSTNKKQLTKQLKAQREKGSGPFEDRGPWAGYGEVMSNGSLTPEQLEKLSKAEETKQVRIEESKRQEKNF